jgi:hypothetical protein
LLTKPPDDWYQPRDEPDRASIVIVYALFPAIVPVSSLPSQISVELPAGRREFSEKSGTAVSI